MPRFPLSPPPGWCATHLSPVSRRTPSAHRVSRIVLSVRRPPFPWQATLIRTSSATPACAHCDLLTPMPLQLTPCTSPRAQVRGRSPSRPWTVCVGTSVNSGRRLAGPVPSWLTAPLRLRPRLSHIVLAYGSTLSASPPAEPLRGQTLHSSEGGLRLMRYTTH